MKQRNKKIGMFIGKFLPPHIGHINKIIECASACDKFYVIVADSFARSKTLCSEAGFTFISPRERFEWLKKIFKNNQKIKVKFLKEGMLEAYPKRLNDWKKKLLNVTNHRANIWFVDEKFLEISKTTFPELSFIGFDRTKISISASEIRKDSKKYVKFLIDGANKYIKNIS